MAFHDGLSRTQKILLAVFCFPLLPFYLCYLCFSKSEEDKTNSDNAAGAEEGRIPKTMERQSRFTGQEAETQNDGHPPVVAFQPDQNSVGVEIHPRQPTPHIRKKFSIRNGVQVFPDQIGKVNKGFQHDGEQQPTHSGRQDQYGVQVSPNQIRVVNKGFQHDGEQQPTHSGRQDQYGVQVSPDQIGEVNKGFQHDGEQQPTHSGRQDLYDYPWDKSSLKSMSIDLEQFKSLDAYASKVNVTSSVENLVNVLLQKAHSDLEKVRAIWIWVCHHIVDVDHRVTREDLVNPRENTSLFISEYDVVGFHNKAKRSCAPEDVLRSRKGVCAGYAGLFEQMCSIAGIQCKNLSGFSKGYGYKPGTVFKGETDHAWNSVYLGGRWHLLDSTWGSGIVDDSCTKFTFRYNEFYFLTHPALFLNDHFPEDYNWQLLKQPLTLQQFEHNACYTPKFYSVGLLEASAKTAVFETENGKATVFIESRTPALFLVTLNGAKEHCLVTMQKNGASLDVYPQQTGTHHLEIFAKSFKDKEKEYSSVLAYSLKCRSVDKSISLPKALIQPVGPSWHSEEKGILEAFPSSPIIHTDDGRCVVTFTRRKDLDVFATLDSDSSPVPEDIRRRHIWKTCKGSQVELKIHLPHAGDFALHIWAKKASDPGSHHCALSYLLSCPNKNVTWPVFPKVYQNWEEGYELVSPLAGVLPGNRQVQFKLKLPGTDEAYVQCGKAHPLTHRGNDFWEGDCDTSGSFEAKVMVSQNPNDNTFWSLLEYKVESH